MTLFLYCFFFFSSRRRHTRWPRDWSSDVCSSDLPGSIYTDLMAGLFLDIVHLSVAYGFRLKNSNIFGWIHVKCQFQLLHRQQKRHLSRDGKFVVQWLKVFLLLVPLEDQSP